MYRWWHGDGSYLGKIAIVFLLVWFGESKLLWILNIDIKGEAEVVKRFCTADVNIVWRNASRAKERGVWVELTTLVIPGVNDTEEGISGIARRIKRELGSDIPWHITGYYPAYKFRSESYVPSTPVSTLEKARDIAKIDRGRDWQSRNP